MKRIPLLVGLLLAAFIVPLLAPAGAAAQGNRPVYFSRKDLPEFDVHAYGATGDGVTDDWPACQLAIDTAKNAGLGYGGRVKFPAGEYFLSRPLVLPRTGATPLHVVELVGAGLREARLVGSNTGTFNSTTAGGVVMWEASTSQAWHQRISDLTIVPPNVDGTRGIYHRANHPIANIAAASDEWLQLSLDNVLIEGSNQYHDVLIDLEVGARFSTWHNVFGDPQRDTPVYSTLLLRVPHQFSDGSNPDWGEDSIGLGHCSLHNLHSVVRRGGFSRLFKGRMYNGGLDGATDNGSRPGDGGYGYDFRNSWAMNLSDLRAEGLGGARQFSFNRCREIRGTDISAAVGFAGSEAAWRAGHAYSAGDRVIPTLLANPTSPAPRNLVYTCTTPGTSGGSEPAWSAAGLTTNDGTGSLIWTAGTQPACSDGIVVEGSEGCHFTGHYMNPASTPASFRLTKAVSIDSACRNVSFENWTVRVAVSGGQYTGNADASAEVAIAAPDSAFNFVAGEAVQSFGAWRSPFKLGQDPARPAFSASLDFPSVAPGATASLTTTLAGANPGDAVVVTPPASLPSGLNLRAIVTAPDTITITLANISAGAIDPPAGTFKGLLLRG